MDFAALRTYAIAQEPALLEALADLVSYEAPSTDKAALDCLAGHLQGRFAALGAQAEILDNPAGGNHVRVTYPGAETLPHALLLCHFDTVWDVGTLARRPFRIEGDRAYGPGTYDMRGGIVVAEYALRTLQALGLSPRRPVQVLLNSDEEIGSPTSRALIEDAARGAAYVLVMESAFANGALKVARKGVGDYCLRVTGRAAHAGVEPEKGISAIEELAHQILHLRTLNDLERGVTVNVGVVRGGTRSNVIPDYAEAHIDLRAWTQEDAFRLDAALRSLKPVLPGVQLTIEGGLNRPPLEFTPQAQALFAQVQALGAALGQDLKPARTGGGSDGNFTAGLGIPTLDGLGPAGDGAHAEHEHVIISSLAPRVALVAAMLAEL